MQTAPPISDQTIVTAEQLWALSHSPDYANMRLELSNGRLIVMAPSGGDHGGKAFNFVLPIGNFVRQHRLGYVTIAEAGFILHTDPDGKDTVRAPDVGYVEKSRFPDGLPTTYIPGAPDLAVEVVSPTDSAAEIQEKVEAYLRYGTRMIIVAYPSTRSVVVHTPTGSHTLTLDDTLDGAPVLPGFTLPIRDIFDDA